MKNVPNEWSVVRAARAIEMGEISAAELCQSLFQRIAERECDVQAWASLDQQRTLVQAKTLDRGPRRGTLHGIPVGIKDVIDTADFPTEYNSPIYKDFRPKADAACVSLLTRDGAIVFGKTVTTEFANIHPAKTRNPLNLSHTPGGSSSGSAAAVADGMIPASLGTQTAGSIIRPACYCGVFAIKPTFGSINRTGVKPLAESLDTVGIFARTSEDLSLILEALSGRIRSSTPEKVSHPRIGLYRTPHWDRLDPEMRAQIELAAHELSRVGAKIRDYDLPPGAERLSEEHHLIMGFESARALSWEYMNCPNLISPDLRSRLSAGWTVTRDQYDGLCALAADFRRRLEDDFKSFDFLLAPSAAGEAPGTLENTGDSLFNRMWTLLGNPCVAVPFGTGKASLPLGFQVIGPANSDMRLLAWATWIEATLLAAQ